MLRGRQLLADRYRNKGTAFSAEERTEFGLHGLLPPVVEDLATQLRTKRCSLIRCLATRVPLTCLHPSPDGDMGRVLLSGPHG